MPIWSSTLLHNVSKLQTERPHYSSRAQWWAELSEEERDHHRRLAARRGQVLNEDTGEAGVPVLDTGKGVVVHPLHWRIAARAGDRAALAYCADHGVPYQLQAGPWRTWLARWLSDHGVQSDRRQGYREPYKDD